ncbi:MAG: hypothetical protein OEY79_01490, partial [Anaplasmataceae bacterium]|nr:hypothetical protein [Anaplasmataceae bacterium]
MCGIIGIIKYTADESMVNLLLNGLKKLEYRGYDSSGITIIDDKKAFVTEKSIGNVDLLIQSIKNKSVPGKIGIGHTRWATHGKISKLNTHPHCDGDIAVVHNGKIDNYQSLLNDHDIKELESETDSAIIPFLINHYIKDGLSFYEATLKLYKQLNGMYSFLAIRSKTGEVIALNNGLSLLIGTN